MPEPGEPIRLESESVFDSDLERPDPKFLEEMDSFLDNPMGPIMKVLAGYLESIKPKVFEPIKSEHKVRIFEINADADLEKVAAEIEALLNDGYCCHIPTVCNDFLIMDFSRRKESEENEINDKSDAA